jgi:hypothetical protein
MVDWNKTAYIVNGQVVTYAELKDSRIEEQKRRLSLILDDGIPLRRAAHIWTFYVPGPFYGGWHLYIRTIKKQWWITSRDCHENWSLVERIMKQFPCGLLPIPENFYKWKEAFAKTYRRVSARRRKQGMVACWVDVENDHRPMPDQIYF